MNTDKTTIDISNESLQIDKHFGNSLSYEEIIEDIKINEKIDKETEPLKREFECISSAGTFTITQIFSKGRCYSFATIYNKHKVVPDGTIASSHNPSKSALNWLKRTIKEDYGLYNERLIWKPIKPTT